MSAIYIRFPYPFRLEEYRRMEKVIERSCGVSVTYVREYPQGGPPVDHLLMDCRTKTTLARIRAVVEALHLQAIFAANAQGQEYCEDICVEVWVDGHPVWAKQRQDGCRDGRAN